jgi:hypothetical protein
MNGPADSNDFNQNCHQSEGAVAVILSLFAKKPGSNGFFLLKKWHTCRIADPASLTNR